jgi:hypothetical protein
MKNTYISYLMLLGNCGGTVVKVLCYKSEGRWFDSRSFKCFMKGMYDEWGTADGGTVVKVLCYNSEGRWFYSRWCHWNFSLA